MTSVAGDRVFAGVLLAVFCLALYQVSTWAPESRPFALVATVPGLIFVAIVLGSSLVHRRPPTVEEPSAEPPAGVDVQTASLRRTALVAGWLVLFLVLVVVLGILPSIPLYVATYLRFGSRERWPVAAIGGVVAWVFVWGLFDRLLGIPLYGGLFGE